MQLLGNLCATLAALIYLLPLQHLLLELARRKDDGGGVLAGLLLLVPMWALLQVALWCVTAAGGFDGLRLGRPALHILVTAGALSLALVSFLRFELVARPGLLERVVQGGPIHLFPVVTLLVVFLSLNPKLAAVVPPQVARWPWVVLAGLCLMLCVGFAGHRLIASGGKRLAGITQGLLRRGELARKNLARVPALDPRRDFSELLGLAGQFQSREVRDAAIARLREHPDLAGRLVAELETGEPDKALEFLNSAELSAAERERFALPARVAMERFTEKIGPELRHMSGERRAGLRRWGTHLFRSVARKLADGGVDFGPPQAAFAELFAAPRDDAR